MVSFSHACRLCLRNEPGNVDIFSLEGQQRLLAQKLWKYFSIWIGAQELLPKTVCQQCIGEIERFSAFFTNVEHVQKSIQQRVSHTTKTLRKDANFTCNYIKVDHIPYVVSSAAENTRLPTVGADTQNVNSTVDDSCLSTDTVVQCGTSNVNDVIEIVKHDDLLNSRGSNLTDDEIACMDLPATDDSQCHESVKDKRNAELASFYNFCCQLCGPEERFDKYEPLDEHCQTQHSKRGVVVCCGKELIGRDILLRHMKSHFQQFKCPECGKQLANRKTLKYHILAIHHPSDKRPYKCKQCPKGFVTKEYLQRHEEVHEAEAANLSFICDTCGKKCRNSFSLYAHQLYVHKRANSAMCHICAKTCRTSSRLRQHLKLHDADREHFKCSECGKMLRNRDTLRYHMRLHNGEREVFRCTQCSRVCTSAAGLRTHLLCHSNKWPHQCQVCKKLFRRKAGLTAHLVIHTGEQPFQCPHCPRTFASQSNYYTHKLRMHTKKVQNDKEAVVVQVTDTGEKRYQCPHCPRTFANKGNYNTHRLREDTRKVLNVIPDESTNDVSDVADENTNGLDSDGKLHYT